MPYKDEEQQKRFQHQWYKEHEAEVRIRNLSAKQTKRAYVSSLKTKPCIDCGHVFHPCAMDFDHINGDKELNVCLLVNCSWKRLLAEIEKCELVCATCHRIRTYKRNHGGLAEYG